MKQKALRQQFIVVFIVLSILAVTSVYLWRNQKQVDRASVRDNRLVVATKRLKASENTPILSIYGYVVVPKSIEIATDLRGEVERMLVKPGDRVEVGQVVLNIDPDDYNLVLTESIAELNALEAQIKGEQVVSEINQQALAQEQKLLALSEKRLKRQQSLSKQGVVTNMILENSQREAEQHRLQVTQRNALMAEHASNIEMLMAKKQSMMVQVERARSDLASTTIYAPASGIVSEVNIAQGARVDGKELLRIIPDGAYEVRGQIPTTYVDEVRSAIAKGVDLDAVIQLDDQSINIKLDRMLPVVSDGQMGQQAVFQFKHQADSELFAHKMPDYIQLQLPKVANSYLLETTAIFPNDTIYVLDDARRLKSVTVTKAGYAYDENKQSMVIVRSDEPLDALEVMTTHIPNPTVGLRVEKYQESPAA